MKFCAVRGGRTTRAHAPSLLVVEDDRDARDIYRATLVHAGYEVQTAGSLAEALTAVARRQPNGVVLDWRLPDGNGLELLRWFKGTRAMQTVPVVMLTAYSEMEHMAEATSSGADGYLVKPCSGDALATYMARALHTGTPTMTLQRPPSTPPPAPVPISDLGDGRFQVCCSRCHRCSPVVWGAASLASRRATELGWRTTGNEWACPICLARPRTRPGNVST